MCNDSIIKVGWDKHTYEKGEKQKYRSNNDLQRQPSPSKQAPGLPTDTGGQQGEGAKTNRKPPKESLNRHKISQFQL